MIRAFLNFYLNPTVKTWRVLRRACMKRLPENRVHYLKKRQDQLRKATAALGEKTNA